MSTSFEYVGTRWYKCDLHLHTTASECFQDQSITPEQWVERAIEKGLDCVAVTDHNTNQGIDAIVEAAQDTSLTIFPGVEITCDTSKVHILVLFDPSKNAQDVYDFLIKCDVDRSKFAKQDAHTEKSALDVAQIAFENGGLVIPAHIDEYSGLGSFSNDILQGFYERDYINAVQVVHKPFLDTSLAISGNEGLKNEINSFRGNPSPELNESKIKEWYTPVKLALQNDLAITTFSDNPHAPLNTKHGLEGIGSRFTYIKMGEQPNLEGLRQAFLLPDFRVWNDFEEVAIPYTQPELWIKSIKILNTFVTGITDPLVINFNPQSNSIIGGRGSGKSSILRFLRGVFNRTEDLDELDDILKDHEEFYQIHDQQSKKGALVDGSTIEIEFIRRKTLYTIKAITNADGSQDVSVMKYLAEIDDWEEVEEAEEFMRYFEYEQYSQKQIYEIAQEPNSLKKRIDGSIDEIEDLDRDLEIKENEYLEIATSIRTMESQVASKASLKTDIKDLQDQINVFKKSGLSELIENNQKFTNGQTKVSGLSEKMEEEENYMQEFLDEFGFETIDLNDLKEEYKTEIDPIVQEAVEAYESIDDELKVLIEKAKKIRSTYNSKISKTKWDKDRLKNIEDLNVEKEKRKEDGIDDLEEFNSISESKLAKETELNDIAEIEGNLKLERKKLDKVKSEHLALIKKITEKRKEYVEGFMQKERVRVKITPFRNKSHFENRLRYLIQRDTGFDQSIQALSSLCFTGNAEQKIVEVKEVFKKIRNDENIEGVVDGRFVNLVKNLSPEQMDRLELFYPEDEIKVEYKPNDAGGWKSLEAASAGQKTTAILTLILLDGETPLILDQPEDDLDNRLVYQLIVDRLKEAKKKRQIIVVTHNANIPVNGDSEYIISMDSESKYIKVLYEGTVETTEIKKEICDVMEGTKEAFEMRSKRYKLNEVS